MYCRTFSGPNSSIIYWIKFIYYNVLYEFILIKIPKLNSSALNGIFNFKSTKFNYDSNEFNSTIGLRLGCKLVKYWKFTCQYGVVKINKI
jgi:hypothetical protein